MELTRSNTYPLSFDPALANRQAQLQGYVEQRVLDERQRSSTRTQSANENNVSARRRTPAIYREDTRAAPVQIVLKQQTSAPAAQVTPQDPLPFGTSSSPFLAQQLAQTPESDLKTDTSSPAVNAQAFQDASTAYGETRNLTVSILGLQGFRERLV